MSRSRTKVRSQSGASLMLALLLFLICAFVGVAVLTAAASNAGKVSHLRQEQQAYLTVSSAARAIRDDVGGSAFTAGYQRVETTVTTWTRSVDGDGEPVLDDNGQEQWTETVSPTTVTYLTEETPALTGGFLADWLKEDCTALFQLESNEREGKAVFPGAGTVPGPHAMTLAADAGADAGADAAAVLGSVDVGLAMDADSYAVAVETSQKDSEGNVLYPMAFTVTARSAWTESAETTTVTEKGEDWETQTVTVTTTCTLTVSWDGNVPILRAQAGTADGGEGGGGR